MSHCTRISAPLNHELIPGLQRIEVFSSLQIPSFQIVGLPGPEVAEARERVRAAIQASKLEFPRRRTVVNLSPASIRKRGTGLDLAIALGILLGTGASCDAPEVMAWGELGLDGTVKPAGQATRAVYSAWKSGVRTILLAAEDSLVAKKALTLISATGEFTSPKPTIHAVSSLAEARDLLKNPSRPRVSVREFEADIAGIPVAQVPLSESQRERIQNLLPLTPSLERAIGAAAMGSHHILLLGPRGSGKSHALEWFLELQPTPSPSVLLSHALLAEMNAPYAFPGSRSEVAEPIARRIGCHVRPAALVGTAFSSGVRPGEFSLAHGGVLLADELPEWPRDSRETLREPLERGVVSLTRTKGNVQLPARFVLAANGNLCACGGWPSDLARPVATGTGAAFQAPSCSCSPKNRDQYHARLSGPVLDRIDLVLLVACPSIPPEQDSAEPTAMVRLGLLREKVERARQTAASTWGAAPGLLSAAQLEEAVTANPAWRSNRFLMNHSSLRGRHKLLRLALSLAAWDDAPTPGNAHFAEASCYRPERFGLCSQ